GVGVAGKPTAEEIDQHVVILSATGGIAQDAIKNAEQLSRFDRQPGFFERFADGGFAQSFADFEYTAGNGPFSGEWRMAAFHQDDAVAFDDDGANANQWALGIFASHRTRNLYHRQHRGAQRKPLKRRGRRNRSGRKELRPRLLSRIVA